MCTNVRCLAFLVSLALTAGASAQLFDAAVELQWADLQNGQIVHQKIDIGWEIEVTAYSGNEGLAAFCADLVQDKSNPSLFDIPPADPASVPTEMEGFVWPAGLGNPGEGSSPSGYFGLQRGVSQQYDLVQIGGAQNSLGQAGVTMGTDANVEADVGSTPVVAVSGSFPTPANAGTYIFRLENVAANVFDEVNALPQASFASEAQMVSTPSTVSFVLCIGDINHSGDVGLADLQLLLSAYGSEPGDANYNADADLVVDEHINLLDLQLLLACNGTQCL